MMLTPGRMKMLLFGPLAIGTIGVLVLASAVRAANDCTVTLSSGDSIRDAVAEAQAGDVICLGAGDYDEGSDFWSIDKSITLRGDGSDQVTIHRSAATSYGLHVEADDVTLEGFTFIGPSEVGSPRYGFKIEFSQGLTIEDVVVKESGRTGIDLHGVQDAVLTDVSVLDNAGAGLAITNSHNVDVSGLIAAANAWGGVALFTSGASSPAGLGDISVSLSTFFDSPVGLYLQDTGETGPAGFTDISVTGNVFHDNVVQVGQIDAAGQPVDLGLDLEAVLADNSFDRAVVVRGSAIKVPAIFSTIQDGVNAAEADDTVEVAAGTYAEDVTIDKDITLLGAQAGVDARGRNGDESHVIGSIHVASDVEAVIIDGFQVTVTVLGPWSNTALVVDAESSAVLNNIIRGVETTGPFTRSGIVDLSGVQRAVVQHNDLLLHLHGPSEQNGVRLGLAPEATVVVVDGNRIRNAAGGGIGVMGGGPAADITISNNDLLDNKDGMWTFNSEFASFLVTGNAIRSNVGVGVNVAGNVASGVQVHLNCIDGNASGVANHVGNMPVAATHNWWGNASGPGDSGPGTGDSVSNNVQFNPWLAGLTNAGQTTFAHDDDVVLEARLTVSNATPVAGVAVHFSRNGEHLGSAVTDANGIATLNVGVWDDGEHAVTFSSVAGCMEGSVDIMVEGEPGEPRDPSEKEQCKNGGWRDMGFVNQGQCIRFFNTGQDSRTSTGPGLGAPQGPPAGKPPVTPPGLAGTNGVPPGLAKKGQ